jgi:hypothetical protein
MADKYKDLAPKPGRCEKVDDVHIRIVPSDSRHRAGRKSHILVEAGSEQTTCPEDRLERCGGCILDSIDAERRHPEWSAIAKGETGA